jgi:hypothetical protein
MAIQETPYYGRSPLYHDSDRPELVLRRPLAKTEFSKPGLVEHDAKFTELLMDLEERYGIRSPNMGMHQTTDEHGSPVVYIQGESVEGWNLSDYSGELPEAAVRQALEAIISYYRNVKIDGGDYLTDLRPSNIIYGRLSGETTDSLYFVDIEPLWATNEPHQALRVDCMERVLPELWMMVHEGVSKGYPWEHLASAYTDLEAMQQSVTRAA